MSIFLLQMHILFRPATCGPLRPVLWRMRQQHPSVTSDSDGPTRARAGSYRQQEIGTCYLSMGDDVNSLAPGKFEWNFRHVIFKQILVIDGWGISCKIALIWMSLDLTDDQSTLVQVMAWCHQATSHYLSQSWLRSLLPFGVTRPQGVNMWCLLSLAKTLLSHR